MFSAFLGILGILIAIAGLCFVMSYYRFTPYYSFVTGKLKGAFSNTKRLITGFFLESIKILVLFAVLNVIIGFIRDNVTTFALYLILGGINTTVNYLRSIVDICFFSSAFDGDVVEQMNMEENPAIS